VLHGQCSPASGPGAPISIWKSIKLDFRNACVLQVQIKHFKNRANYFVSGVCSSGRDGDVKHGACHSWCIGCQSACRRRAASSRTVVEANAGNGAVEVTPSASQRATGGPPVVNSKLGAGLAARG
jgi:hypothetical protein